MATIQFILKITDVNPIQHISDKFYKAEAVGIEVRNDEFENVIKVQGNNKMADRIQQFSVGEVIQFVCELEGRRWVKEDREIIFQNLIVKEYKTMGVKQEAAPYTGNPKKADVNDMFPSADSQKGSAAQDFGYDNDLPF